jgi:hypothetical protein
MNFELYCSDLKHTAKFFDNEDLQWYWVENSLHVVLLKKNNAQVTQINKRLNN